MLGTGIVKYRRKLWIRPVCFDFQSSFHAYVSCFSSSYVIHRGSDDIERFLVHFQFSCYHTYIQSGFWRRDTKGKCLNSYSYRKTWLNNVFKEKQCQRNNSERRKKFLMATVLSSFKVQHYESD
jgi:hypothetical protein